MKLSVLGCEKEWGNADWFSKVSIGMFGAYRLHHDSNHMRKAVLASCDKALSG